MAFIDGKSRVIDLQLTQFGKYLVSKGKFRPEYYALFDDDILYDARFADVEENQNDAQQRIINETPYLEAVYNFSGRETEIKKINEQVRAGSASVGDDSIQPEPEKHYALGLPIGSTRLDTFDAPAWSVDVLKGEIAGAVEFKTGSHPSIRIPQLNIKEIEYKTFVDSGLPVTGAQGQIISPDQSEDGGAEEFLDKFSDGSFLRIYEDSFVIEINEENTFFLAENFDIEVYEVREEEDVKTENATQEVLIPLYFRRPRPQVVNDLLVDEEQMEQPEITPEFAEYFVEVLADREINPQLLCELVPVERRDDLYNRTILDCREEPPKAEQQTYRRTVFEEPDKCEE